MKKNILKSITYFLIITTLISCGSTPKREPQEPQIEQKTNTKRELKVLNSQNKQVEKTEPTEVDFYKDKTLYSHAKVSCYYKHINQLFLSLLKYRLLLA